MSDKYRLIMGMTLSTQLLILGIVTALKYVTKENSFGFDVVVMGIASALTTLIATWKKSAD